MYTSNNRSGVDIFTEVSILKDDAERLEIEYSPMGWCRVKDGKFLVNYDGSGSYVFERKIGDGLNPFIVLHGRDGKSYSDPKSLLETIMPSFEVVSNPTIPLEKAAKFMTHQSVKKYGSVEDRLIFKGREDVERQIHEIELFMRRTKGYNFFIRAYRQKDIALRSDDNGFVSWIVFSELGMACFKLGD